MATNIHLKFNDQAPDLTLLDGAGNPVQLSSLWKKQVLVLAFTRHFGCPQCKEMVDQLIDSHQTLTEAGLLLAIVSHASPESAKAFCDQRAPNALCLADPDRTVYKAYGLYRGTLWQTILSPNIWKSNRRLARQKGIKPGVPSPGQDVYQMSGTFVIGMDGKIRLPYYYEDIADHPPVDLLLHGIMGVDWKKPFDSKPLV
ncbi:MAG TPA: peroxiredoxin-like family protein [Anaerolineales bacterium]|nr:peroxiredoxin-like family protein [Anaerolineales bacterium]